MKSDSALRGASRLALSPLQASGMPPPALFPTKQKDWVVGTHHEIEGVQFDPTFLAPFELGFKALTVAMFRLAAHGVDPASAQVSVGVNQATTEVFLDEVFRGAKKAASENGISLSFGNSTHSPTAFFISITLLGKRMGSVGTPRAGDLAAVTGTVGNATAGLHCLRRFGWPAVTEYAAVVRAHLNPKPPLQQCLELQSAKSVTSLRPLIDGLASELHRLAQSKKVGLWVDEKTLPISDHAREAARLLSLNARQWGLFGAEDFGLLVTVHPKKIEKVSKQLAKQGVALTVIGEVHPASFGVKMRNEEGVELRVADRSWNPILRKKTK